MTLPTFSGGLSAMTVESTDCSDAGGTSDTANLRDSGGQEAARQPESNSGRRCCYFKRRGDRIQLFFTTGRGERLDTRRTLGQRSWQNSFGQTASRSEYGVDAFVADGREGLVDASGGGADASVSGGRTA